MISFERLIAEHRAVAAALAALTRATQGPAGSAEVREMLISLDQALRPHLHLEDQEIYPKLLASADAGDRIAAQGAITRWASLAGDWDVFFDQWDENAITGDRKGFIAALANIATALSGRVSAENEILYPMALRGAHIALRGK